MCTPAGRAPRRSLLASALIAIGLGLWMIRDSCCPLSRGDRQGAPTTIVPVMPG